MSSTVWQSWMSHSYRDNQCQRLASTANGHSWEKCAYSSLTRKQWFTSYWKITLSEKGRTYSELGMYSLKEILEPNTLVTSGSRYILLILDGHGSYATHEFYQICKSWNIITSCMPHSSHLLQPLDVTVLRFSNVLIVTRCLNLWDLSSARIIRQSFSTLVNRPEIRLL